MERRLGRGLGSLLSDRDSSRESPSSTSNIDVGLIRPNPHQPRRHFDPEGLEELAESLRQHGVLQPIVVRQAGSIFELIAGERRLRAAQRIGMTQIPAVVRRDVSDELMLELALVENVQRRDLDPIERALGYRQLLEQLSLTQEEVAQRVGLKRATVTNHIRLLELPAPVQEALVRGLISMGHARALLGVPDATLRVDLAAKMVEEGWSVREVERRVRELVQPPSPAEPVAPERPAEPESDESEGGGAVRSVEIPSWVAGVQDRLQESLGTRVEVRARPGYSGQIVVHYFDREELERLLDQLAPPQRI
ncbi:MAG: ParB/RepB/Spo0J family partition protein [Planctomycetaceae bacterium]|nr:ParB/RepB/Spo0J family partition protein [Planctomycetaceae bacterium]